jgi:HK97 family phage major capsid protein
VNRNPLFSPELTDAELGDFAALATGWPQLSSEQVALAYCEREQVVSIRHEMRQFLREVQADANPSPKHQNAARVATLALRALDRELDLRSEAGDPSPRATPGRKSPPDSSDSLSRPLARAAGDASAAPRIGGSAAGGFGAARVLACYRGDGAAGWRDFGSFAQAVARKDPRLFAAASGMQTGVAADGGATVPPGFLRDLMAASLEQEAVRPRARIVPMPVGTVSLPRFNAQDRSAGTAGLTGKPTAEGATAATQKAKTDAIVLNATKLVVLVPSTLELVEDGGPAFGQLLSDYLRQAMSATVDDYLLLGNGTAQPLGIVNAPCTVEVAKESGQAAATIEPANLSKMVARLAPGSFRNAVWLCHSSVLAQLFVLHQRIANAAANDWVGGFAPGWFSTAPDGTMQLLSRPLIVTDRLQPLGTSGDIVLADLTQYIVGEVGDARLAVDGSVGFKESEIWFRLVLRLDGQPALTDAITPRRGSDTLSPFVKLATRS